MELEGMTPAQRAGIMEISGKNKWLQLMEQAMKRL
jgi:hypothetical protein